MATVFVCGVIAGIMISAGSAVMLGLSRAEQKAAAFEQLSTELVEQLRVVQVKSYDITKHALNTMAAEIVASILERVDSKLPLFLPNSTRASIHDSLDQTIKRDLAPMIGHYTSELVSAANAKQASYCATVLKLEKRWMGVHMGSVASRQAHEGHLLEMADVRHEL